ncbi:MAG: Asp-tRNA(Asn)/Glu-tRNA(Gln) amidotransferase subunit GatA [Candidatus Improbicoccus devescovinae]|nr:MAG: Asp-tRNA(Asn)/Glu-tRNA(Gln) amidotransferase subunit GatA [Candidatus Improbicoccus devescovinae]
MSPNTGIILKIHELLTSKTASCVEITQNYLKEIKKNVLNAYITVTEEEALNSAKKVDEKIAKNQEMGILEGIPVGIKDVISTKNVRTTCGSKMLANYVPIYDATCWEILKLAGVVLLGKNNQDEFAMGSSNETSFFGPVKNPHDLTKVPGGSSGGGAAAVAGGLAAFTIGTDTGGSIRQPSAFCGTVGFKPSYGSVSRYGLIPLASSFDQAGPITLTVEDACLVFDAISKFDSKDATSSSHIRKSSFSLRNDSIKNIKIGIPKECLEGIDPEITTCISKAINIFEDLGAETNLFSFPEISYAIPIYYILSCAEASSNLGRFDGIRYGFRPESYDNYQDLIIKSRTEGFGAEIKRRILLGTYVLGAGFCDDFYKRAQKLREFLTGNFMKIFEKFDIILMPVTPTTAFGFNYSGSDPIKMYLSDICTVAANEARLPAISIPCGYSSKHLPIGMQLLASRFNDEFLLNVAYKYESQEFHAKVVSGYKI